MSTLKLTNQELEIIKGAVLGELESNYTGSNYDADLAEEPLDMFDLEVERAALLRNIVQKINHFTS